MHNGVSAASGLSGNDIRQDERIRRVIIKLGGEGVRVGQALGYKLEASPARTPKSWRAPLRATASPSTRSSR